MQTQLIIDNIKVNIDFVYIKNLGTKHIILHSFTFHLTFRSKSKTFISSLDRLVVRTLRCGRNNPGSNTGLDNILSIASLVKFILST